MNAQASSVPVLRATAVVVALLLSSILMPLVTGLDSVAGLIGSGAVSGLAASYAWRHRSLIGPRWAWFAGGVASFWVAGLAIFLPAPLPPGGATVR